jgi:hypothetical protein
MDTPLPATPFNILQGYGRALELGGVFHAKQLVEQLTSDPARPVFGTYYPDAQAFGEFQTSFRFARRRVMKENGWSYDEKLLATDPISEQSLKSYYDAVFNPMIHA